MEKWAGKDTEEAAKSAIYSGVKTILLGAAIYTASQQIGKILTKKSLIKQLRMSQPILLLDKQQELFHSELL